MGLTILQLSDIHFAYPAGANFDLDREIQDGLIRFLPELREMTGGIDLIVISGDIAFSGVTDQYERAKGYLREIRAGLGDRDIPVRVVPGNHDIHRETTDNADQRRWRATPRGSGMSADERAAELAKLLGDATSGPELLRALESYNTFAAPLGCSISADEPWWEEVFDLGEDGWKLRVRGLTSVLVSNEHDEKDRLVLGLMQLGGLQFRAGEVNLTLCHHPYCWLLDGEELRPKMENRSHIHITGHVHRHTFCEKSTHVHLMAGAMQPPRSEKAEKAEKAEKRFNVISLNVVGETDPRLEVTLLPLLWVPQRDSFVVDNDNCKACSVALVGPPAKGTGSEAENQAALTRLAERLDALPFSDRLHVAKSIGMSPSELLNQREPERVPAVIRRASGRAKLAELWEQVELHHGNQSDASNPFEVTE
jgi:predicted phosphodiesterase